MKSINLSRKKPDEKEQNALKIALKEAYEDDENGRLMIVHEDGENLEAVLVPVGTSYKNLFNEIISSGAQPMEFNWDDPDLCAQLGLCVMQHALRSNQNLVLVNEEEMYFALVSKEVFDQYK